MILRKSQFHILNLIQQSNDFIIGAIPNIQVPSLLHKIRSNQVKLGEVKLKLKLNQKDVYNQRFRLNSNQINMSSQPKAIPFILKNPETQLYELSSQAQGFLKNIDGPLSVVTVAGLYRTGKSYLLNRVILNKSEGFNVGPTVNACTKGLWIWNQSIHSQDNRNVLVIDTEGLGALDEQANHDMKIFSLAVLLSTTFIYNSVGNIDENALQSLSLVLNLVSNIDKENQSSRPSFVWVVRDFSLQLIDEKGNTISPKQYLQMALNSDGAKQPQKAQIRKNITNAFSERDCFTLYKPLIDQNKLQRLDTIPLEQLRPQFVSQTMALRKQIFNNLNSIKLSNSALKGAQYVIMVKKFIQAINQGKVPNITDTWTFIKQEKTRQISSELIDSYTQKIRAKIFSRLPLKFVQLDQLTNSLWHEMIDQFHRLTYQQSSPQQIQQFYQRIRFQIKSANQQQMKAFLKNILNKQYQNFSKKMYSDYYQSIQQFSSDIDKNFKQMIVVNYIQKVEGLNASISSFLQKKYIDAFKYFSAKLKLQIKRVSENKDEIEQFYKKQVQKAKVTSTQYQSQLKQKIVQMDKKMIQSTRKNQEYEKLLEAQKQQNKGKGMKIQNKLQHLNQTLMQMQQRNDELQSEKNKFQKQVFLIKKQNDKQLALMKQKNQYLGRQQGQQQRRYQDMKKLLDEKMTVQEQQKKKYYSSNQERFKALIQQNQTKSDKIFELQHMILDLNEQYSEKVSQLQKRQAKLFQEKQKMKENLTQDFSNKKESHNHQLNSLRDQCRKYEQQLQISLVQRNQLESKVKQLYEQLKHIKYSSQKQIAIHLQRIQFHEAEIKQLKNNNEDIKKNYQSMIQSIQGSSKTSQEKYVGRINQTTEQFECQIKVMEKQYSQKIYESKRQVSTLKATKQDLQIELSLQKKKHESKQKQFKESYGKLQSLYKNLTQKLSNSQKGFHDLNKQKQNYFTMRIKQLERQVQEVKQKSMREVQQTQANSEQALGVLKNYTQIQRHQWERRLQDQKDKNNRNVQNIKLEYQKKMLQQKQALQDQNSMLQDKIDQMEKYFTQTLQNMRYDHEIQTQKLSNQFMEEKVQINKQNALLTQQMQLTKINMQNRLDQSKRNFQQIMQSLKIQLQNQLKQQQFRFKEQKQFLQSKCESLKKTNKSVQQQNLILKNELDKQKALFKQKQSGHLRNINDLEQRLSHQLFNHTKTIEQITNANNTQRKRLNNEIDSLKSSKAKLQDEKSNLAMEKDAIETKLSSKLSYLENKIKTNKADYDDLMNKFQLTSNFLNKKIQSMQRQKQQLHLKVKSQFEQQISVKQDNYKKENKQYNDRIYRLQTQNKSLRDKVILMELKLSSQCKNNVENSQFEKLEQMKEEYMKREEEYRKVIDRLKKQNKKIKEQRQLLELTSNLDKTRHNNQHTGYKDCSQRESIIGGLNEYTRQDASRSRLNLDNSKIMNTSTFNQSRISNVNAMGQNKNVINRKSNVSPMMANKKYSNNTNYRQTRQDQYEGARYY